jgi:hypothetical protein
MSFLAMVVAEAATSLHLPEVLILEALLMAATAVWAIHPHPRSP